MFIYVYLLNHNDDNWMNLLALYIKMYGIKITSSVLNKTFLQQQTYYYYYYSTVYMNYKYIAHFPVIIVPVAGLARDHYMFKFYIPSKSKILRRNEGATDWLTHKPNNQQFAQKEEEICNSVQYSHPKEEDRIIHKQKKN